MSRGIFEADRLKFSLHLIHDLFSNEIPGIEWDTFIRKNNTSKIDLEETPLWIPKQCVMACQNMQVINMLCITHNKCITFDFTIFVKLLRFLTS